MLLVPQVTLQEFDKWVVDFVGPINPIGKTTSARYIIIVTDYLTKWDKSVPVRDCTAETVAKFLFKNVVTQFGCPKILISDQVKNFINQLIEELTE